ncbi:MAG: GNAT family N-acetyltransferase [Verrucomicrobiales bacterium]|nr:GNAT family N-acetyltransferase [Verrucomicrobiales bacterium]
MNLPEHRVKLLPVPQEDWGAIREAAERIWPSAYSSILDLRQIEYMLEMMYSEVAIGQDVTRGVHYRWIHCAGKNAGFAAFGPVEVNGPCELHKLYVEAPLQGKGVGKSAVEVLAEELRDSGARAIRLRVNRHNANALQFYRRVGFSVYAEDRLDIGNGFEMDDFLMEKPLT